MSTSYFINDRIYLRAIEPEDLDIMYAMENDPQTWDITNFTVPYSRYALRQYIENSQCDMFADCQLRLMIVRRDDRTVIGTIDITEFMPIHARGEVGIVIRKEYQGQGRMPVGVFAGRRCQGRSEPCGQSGTAWQKGVSERKHSGIVFRSCRNKRCHGI